MGHVLCSTHILNLKCLRLPATKKWKATTNVKILVLSHPLGDLGVTHRVHLWLDGKRVVDFLLAIIPVVAPLTADITKIVFGRGSAPEPARGPHDASSDPIVGWKAGYPISTPSPRRLRRLDSWRLRRHDPIWPPPILQCRSASGQIDHGYKLTMQHDSRRSFPQMNSWVTE